jgi:tetratricopeptide (TPR) repeat protein
VSLLTLLAAGFLLQPLQDTAWAETRARQPELDLNDLGDSLGQGLVLGVLGGFRSILADFVWIRGYVFWAQKTDPANTEACVRLAATLDPHDLMFWDDGSSIIGYDIPAWHEYDKPHPTDEQMHEYMEVAAKRAIDFLDRGLKFEPNNYRLLFDQAMLYYNKLDDLPDAAEKYREAADHTNIPYLAARTYIRILRRLGRDREALDYMKKFYPTLPNGVPEVQKNLMWGWILGLEDALKVPQDQRMPESMAPPGWNAKDYMDDFKELSAPQQ